MRIHCLITLLLAGLVQGCVTASSVPELPETLGENGLLVGKVYMPGSHRWGNSQVTINGRVHNASLRDGYLALSLAPGEYTLQNLRTEGWNEKVSHNTIASPFVPVRSSGGGYRAPVYVPGTTSYRTVYTVYYTTLPINQKFTIAAGKITSVGMYVFLTGPKEPKKFITVQLDNTREMRHYLDTNYPALMGGITDKNIILASGKYIEAAKLPTLRQLIAAKEIGAGRLIPGRNTTITYGNAGTIVVLRPDKGKKDAPPKAEILDTGTLADINDVQFQGERLNFLTADGQILTFDNNTLNRQTIPYQVQPLRFRYFGQHGIVVVDNRRRLLLTNNNGQNWSRYEGVMLEKPSNLTEITATHDGIYLYSADGVPKSISFHGHNQAAHVIIPPPSERGRIPAYARGRLVATDAGLFIDYFGAGEFHFKPTGKNDWQLRSTPAEKCGRIVYEPAGRVLNVRCEKTGYRSDDAGQNWLTQTGT